MRLALSDEQVALRDGVRAMLAAECTPAVVRAAWGEHGSDAAARARSGLWARSVELGLAGAAVDVEHGGLGLSACDLVPLLEEAGRVAAPLPIVETIFVAGPALAAAGERELIASLLTGELLVACGLDGSAVIPFASAADLALVSEGAWEGTPLRLLGARESTTPAVSIDAARAAGVLGDGPAGDGRAGGGRELALPAAASASAWQRGALGCAAQLIGLSRALLELTVAYVKDRRQFGVPVGSFQAVKHHLADALIAIEFAAPAVLRGAWSYDTEAPETERDIAMAKALASEAAERVAAIALQCHGAIGYTTEYDLHLFAKRVWASSRTWGGAEWQRSRVATALGLPEHVDEQRGRQA